MPDEGNEPKNEQELWEDVVEHEEGDHYEDIDVRDSFTHSYKYAKQYIPGQGFSKYHPALKNLILVRRKKKKKESLGIDEAGLWSFITFRWLSKYIYKGHKSGLTLDDIPETSPYDTSEYNVQRLETLWLNELSRKGPQSASLGLVTWKFIRTRVLVASAIFILYNVFCFIGVAFFMRGLLMYSETEDASVWTGIQWAVLLTINELFRITFYSMVWAVNFRTAVRLRSAFLAMIYRKILRLHCLQDKTVGELINIFSTDGQRVFDLLLFGPMVIGGPISIILCLSYVYFLLGIWAVLGLCSFFLFYPIQYGLSHLSGYIKRKAITVTDKRMNAMSEILNSIKLIKLYAWNSIFKKKIFDIRKNEKKFIKQTALCQSLAMSMSSTAPIISAIVTFLVHIAAGSTLLASQAFTVMSLYYRLMRNALNFTREGFKIIIDVKISLRRFKSVLLLHETKIYLSRPLDKSQAICIANASFARYKRELTTKKTLKDYAKNEKADNQENETLILNPSMLDVSLQEILFEINFFAPKGKLIGICGQVGSGKTSLLNAILGQLPMTKGKLCREGSCALVSQQPWLMNATLKENVLFGEKFNAKKYFNALFCCGLNEDINALPGGDETEVGDRGINLSGGQKQRVSLARALYGDRDIYLLDDPLSAVDAHVASHIFEKYICSALKSKTVLFVTHQMQYLAQCDDIVVMKDGSTEQRGTYDDLINQEGEFKLMVESLKNMQAEEVQRNKSLRTSISEIVDGKQESEIVLNGKESGGFSSDASLKPVLSLTESSLKGSVKLDTILSYIRASGGVFIAFFLVFLMFLNVGSTAFSSWWLAQWIKAGHGNATASNETDISLKLTDNPEFSTYQLVYALTIAVILISNLLRGYVYTAVTLKASAKIHNTLFTKLLKAPMSFFETTPIGKIHNLFSKDVDEVEVRLPISLETLIQDVWQLVFAILFISLVSPFFLLPMACLAFVYYTMSKIFRVGMRDLKRLENLSRSPIFSTVEMSVLGLDTIHAFGKEKEFMYKFTRLFDQNTTCLYMCCIGARWLAIRLDAIAVVILVITSCMVIMLHGTVPPSMAGLAIAYAATISGLLQFTIRQATECELRFLSVEKINMYIHGIEQEGSQVSKENPPESWPELGTIRFSHVYLRYRPGLPYALNDVSFKIRAGEKVGIVGRTGSGKSSLLSALFRIVEISRGQIKIGNTDIASLDLDTLRSRLTIIPQDPILFSGTIRSNLDPGDSFTDTEIWSALEKTKLKEKISSSENKLSFKVTQSGNNLSVGEKQLLCLARALLKQSKIIVLDEATSGIDPDTESVIQRTITEELRDSTVLTIAHRLETITSCNRIIVMENGQIVEFDEPSALLQNTDSLYSKLNSAYKFTYNERE